MGLPQGLCAWRRCFPSLLWRGSRSPCHFHPAFIAPEMAGTTARSIRSFAWTPLNDSLQSSLFTRLTMVDAEFSAVRGLPTELQVNQDELRRNRDEWRWRAERLLSGLQGGVVAVAQTADEVLDAVTSWFRGLTADEEQSLEERHAEQDRLGLALVPCSLSCLYAPSRRQASRLPPPPTRA
jgi:hypothetical protein